METSSLLPGINQISLPKWLSGKESACNAGDTGDVSLIPGSGRSHGKGNGNPLQYSCLENPMGLPNLGIERIHTSDASCSGRQILYQWCHLGEETLIQYGQCPYKKEIPGMCLHRGKAIWRHHLQPRREASGETNPDDTLILDFQSPVQSELFLLLFKPLSLWYFAVVVLAS